LEKKAKILVTASTKNCVVTDFFYNLPTEGETPTDGRFFSKKSTTGFVQ
jgi:hypothetical protein